jgi:sugar phosphate isomerase/epimerase
VALYSSLQFSIQLGGLGMPFSRAVNLAAELKADAVEIDAQGEITPENLSGTGLREVRKMLTDRRLRVAAVTFRTRRGYGTPDELDRRVAATKAAMELASRLAAPLVVNAIGPIPSDDDPAGRQLLRDVLSDLGRFGNRVGATLAAETGSESGSQLAHLLAELPEQYVVVAMNPGKLMAGGFSPLDAIADLGRWIRYVQATDARRKEPIALGRGDADFPALLAALSEHGYRGDFAIGCTSTHDSKRELADAMAQLRRFAGLS